MVQTQIRVTAETKKQLDQLKLTKGESYENVIIRLLNIYEPLLKGDSNVCSNVKRNTQSIKRVER